MPFSWSRVFVFLCQFWKICQIKIWFAPSLREGSKKGWQLEMDSKVICSIAEIVISNFFFTYLRNRITHESLRSSKKVTPILFTTRETFLANALSKSPVSCTNAKWLTEPWTLNNNCFLFVWKRLCWRIDRCWIGRRQWKKTHFCEQNFHGNFS